MIRLRVKVIRVLGVVAAMMLAVGAVYFVILSTENSTQRLCRGILSVEDLKAAIGSEEQEVSDEMVKSGHGEWGRCKITAETDAKSAVMTVEIDGIGSNWPYSPSYLYDRQDIYREAIPVGGGTSGWVSDRSGSVWLPDSCAQRLGTGAHPPILRLNFERGHEPAGGATSLRTLLIKMATGAAEQAECSEQTFAQELPPLDRREVRTGKSENECDLNGFAIRRNDEKLPRMVNYIAGDIDSTWSCLIGVEGGEGVDGEMAMTAFTVTDSPQVVNLYKARTKGSRVVVGGKEVWGEWVNRKDAGSVLMRCDGREMLASMEYPYEQSNTSAKNHSRRASSNYLLKPRELFDAFTSTLVSQRGCQAISG
ncbi:hypothetical protein H3146_21355 [Streptomyces sp. OF3]|uniref:Uncharacterized protein n=1 Tax=Streptomyces alkaliterrae TaxID=2213162 RepID=A0A7W3WP27_9ACTN|nr:hypothetical protein [Streptomyces alkaliterrae]MBB1255886.1 hypothetical protein [Streptomyces alkaliterrae]